MIYLRVKAVEALGRIHAPESISALKRIVEAKKFLGWLHPQELRIGAMQALENLDPAWAIAFLPHSGLDKADLTLAPLTMAANCKFVRQRRHKRVRLSKPVTAVSTNLKEACSLQIKTASLTGGVATISRHLAPGTPVQLKFQLGMRNLQATALMRDYRAQDMAFEIVDMSLDERSRLRRLLADSLSSRSDSTGSDETPAPSDTPVAAGARSRKIPRRALSKIGFSFSHNPVLQACATRLVRIPNGQVRRPKYVTIQPHGHSRPSSRTHATFLASAHRNR